MKLKSLKIGNLTTENNVFLAPLAGFTDFAFRSICVSLGAGLTFTEMVSCKGLFYNNENTEDLLYTAENEKIKCVQVFGSDPAIMRTVLESKKLSEFKIADINFGCPMPKIFNNGEGSALLENFPLAEKIIKECVKSGKIITCKIRTGITEGKYITEDFAKMCEQAGAALVTVHGRTRDKIYAGAPNFEEIRKAKLAVKIPVIANGGIFTAEDADGMIERTGADGIMIARGALENPFIFSEITGKNVEIDKKNLIFKNIDLLKERYSDRSVTVNMRKQIALYLKGERGAAALKNTLFKLETTAEIKELLDGFFK